MSGFKNFNDSFWDLTYCPPIPGYGNYSPGKQSEKKKNADQMPVLIVGIGIYHVIFLIYHEDANGLQNWFYFWLNLYANYYANCALEFKTICQYSTLKQAKEV